MGVPEIPTSVVCDSSHAEITIIFLIILVTVFAKLFWNERQKNVGEEERAYMRIEAKLDSVINGHIECQKQLPVQFVTKEIYKELLAERNRQWELFNEKFEKFIQRFWNHSHDTNGKVDRQ
jgi:cbb3-type cytochrome oxidase subunit 3